ncbi:MAG: hypothetical protein KGJ62_01455 [Armatimonadetes bacterium]|nr:hypothetical protein [Armatimonadota bacterium]MDE2205829.1 hypothetical protein [Armatimonadota bacterium]
MEEVLGRREAGELWATGYRPAFPLTPQEFTLGGVLPAVLYMMRWGQRRGKGNFEEVYDRPGVAGKKAAILDVSNGLSSRFEWFKGFDNDAGQAILGDLLLAYCLENRRHCTGREEQVQRVFPTHYFASWVDLPPRVAHLRGVPELVTTTLARQLHGPVLERSHRGHFAVGRDFDSNLLLRIFGTGAYIEGQPDNLSSDRFDESADVGLDQLLTIRLAQSLHGAPTKMRDESPDIINQQPVSLRATETFYDDLNVFLRAYGTTIPRQALLPILESYLALGLTNILFSTLRMLLQWAESGTLPPKADESSWSVFVDCSMSMDYDLRRASEESMDDLVQRLGRLPVCMMCLRILDQRARQERLDGLPEPTPDPTNRVNYLGDLLFDRLEASRDIEKDIRRTCFKLSDALKDSGEDSPAVDLLDDDNQKPAWRLAGHGAWLRVW